VTLIRLLVVDFGNITWNITLFIHSFRPFL